MPGPRVPYPSLTCTMKKLPASLLVLVLSGLLLAPSHALSSGYPTAAARSASSRAGFIEFGRWDVCMPIEYSVDWTGAPRSARRDLLSVVRLIGTMTGLEFRDTGATPRIPRSANRFPEGRHVIIGWTSSKKSELLGRGTLGTAWRNIKSSSTADGPSIITAAVVFDASRARNLRPGFGPRGHATLILHEMLHAVGLSHSASRSSVMYPTMGYGPGRMSTADKRTLRRLYPKSLVETCGIPTTTTTEPEDPEFES